MTWAKNTWYLFVNSERFCCSWERVACANILLEIWYDSWIHLASYQILTRNTRQPFFFCPRQRRDSTVLIVPCQASVMRRLARRHRRIWEWWQERKRPKAKVQSNILLIYFMSFVCATCCSHPWLPPSCLPRTDSRPTRACPCCLSRSSNWHAPEGIESKSVALK